VRIEDATAARDPLSSAAERPVRARIAREQRNLCDRGVGADEEIRQYPGAATSLSTITRNTLPERNNAARGISISLSPTSARTRSASSIRA
jgi:hypothetical protein